MTPQQAVQHLLANGMTLYRIAKELKISHGMPKRYLSGKTKTMNVAIAARFEEEFGIKIDEECTYKF